MCILCRTLFGTCPSPRPCSLFLHLQTELKHLRYKLFVKSGSREGTVPKLTVNVYGNIGEVNLLKVEWILVIYLVIYIVNTLQSTRFIGKYMLFFLWTLANARHTSGLTFHFFTYTIAREISVLYPALVEMRLNCTVALTNLTLTGTPGGSSLVCLNRSSCM